MTSKLNSLSLAIGTALAGLSINATAETISGVTAPYYDPGSFGPYFSTPGVNGGAAYQYAVGVNVAPVPNGQPAVTAANGFGDRWQVRGDEHLMNDPMIFGHQLTGVSLLSWCANGTCAGGIGQSYGLNKRLQTTLFAVTTEADIRISVSNAPSVEGADGPNEVGTGAIGNNLIPGYTLYSGMSTQGWAEPTFTFPNQSDFTPNPYVDSQGSTLVPAVAPDLIYLAHDANTTNDNSISNVYHLTPGLYTLMFGANIANTPNTDEDLACITQNGPGGPLHRLRRRRQELPTHDRDGGGTAACSDVAVRWRTRGALTRGTDATKTGIIRLHARAGCRSASSKCASISAFQTRAT